MIAGLFIGVIGGALVVLTIVAVLSMGKDDEK